MTRLQHLLLRALTGLLAFGALGLDCQPLPEDEPNTAPTARVVWPQLAATGAPVRFDGAQSSDAEGPILRYEMTFGDGTEARTSDDGVFEHTYGAAGSYTFLFSASDEDGTRGEIEGTVVLADNIDDPQCSCSNPCQGLGVCTNRGCVLAQRSAPIADAGPGDDVVVDGALSCGTED